MDCTQAFHWSIKDCSLHIIWGPTSGHLQPRSPYFFCFKSFLISDLASRTCQPLEIKRHIMVNYVNRRKSINGELSITMFNRNNRAHRIRLVHVLCSNIQHKFVCETWLKLIADFHASNAPLFYILRNRLFALAEYTGLSIAQLVSPSSLTKTVRQLRAATASNLKCGRTS